jgi:hypothetical protein
LRSARQAEQEWLPAELEEMVALELFRHRHGEIDFRLMKNGVSFPNAVV